MAEKPLILERLANVDDSIAQEASHWLSREDVRPLTSAPASTTVYEAIHLWRVRQKSSISRGRTLRGAEPLLEKLNNLTPQKKLEQYAFRGNEASGNIFFEKANGRFVGAVLVHSDKVSA